MKKYGIVAALGLTFFLAGCEEVKSVDWWQSHPDEATKKVAECKNLVAIVIIAKMPKMVCLDISNYILSTLTIKMHSKINWVKREVKRSHYGNF